MHTPLFCHALISIYRTYSGGVFAGDTYRLYLSSDSTDKKMLHIATMHHDNEKPFYRLKDDTLYMYKLVRNNNIKRRVVDTFLINKIDLTTLNKN